MGDSRRVISAAAEKGLDFRFKPVDTRASEHTSPEFGEMEPFGN